MPDLWVLQPRLSCPCGNYVLKQGNKVIKLPQIYLQGTL